MSLRYENRQIYFTFYDFWTLYYTSRFNNNKKWEWILWFRQIFWYAIMICKYSIVGKIYKHCSFVQLTQKMLLFVTRLISFNDIHHIQYLPWDSLIIYFTELLHLNLSISFDITFNSQYNLFQKLSRLIRYSISLSSIFQGMAKEEYI